ncbi:iron chelate uptake ABC transporter family permease subunit [Pseudonocardia sp. NPDC049635]|uniref:iron chelate uptake ABC transporter family permease subunit n=1 Tax=Pseudonocardia sp. NPDC049635 TaxID=3155506 RepID=UPI0034042239
MADTVPRAAAGPTRRTRPLHDRRHAIRYWASMAVLTVLSLSFVTILLTYGNPMPFGTDGFWRIVTMRTTDVVVILVVALCQSFATVSFQTATNNRIITPSIMGFEALYVAVQTAAVFLFGVAGFVLVTGPAQFLLQAGLMVAFATLLYSWLLSGRFANLHIMLLVGVVIGGGLGSLSAFLQRLLTPSEFDVLTARLFGNVSNARSEYLVYAIPIALVAAAVLYWRARRLDVVALGGDVSRALGVNHLAEQRRILLLVSILMAMTTALVGPMTFFGFLVATLAYQLADTYGHRLLLPMSFLIGVTVLSGAYVVLRHVFYAQGAVTIIIELVGGTVFLVFLLRKGRL